MSAASESRPLDELERLRRRNEKLSSLLQVATALTREHQLEAVLDLILAESVKTVDADRGSLFIVDRSRTELLSKIALGERATIRMPIGRGIAGTVARTGIALNIPDAYADSRFNPEVDKLTGYRTSSILCVPMLGSKQEVVGVVQALNHRDGPFSSEDEELLMALGASAAAAIENANLYEDIERLFEGFVQASITAIESRDPTTAGHSGRVADLSVTLMNSLERSSGPYRGLTFSPLEVRELRYAALLHDFGKVGVREHVLLKANKLYPHELERLEQRFEQARRALEVELLRAELDVLRREPGRGPKDAEALAAELQRRQAELEGFLEFVRRCNRPTVLEEGGFERLQEVAEHTFTDSAGCAHALLTPGELSSLSIARGSLNAEERREIESHVVHTFNFLNAIPWTRELARVPHIAHGHHEKLNGRGYPRAVPAPEIPVQTRMMTIADIYDALTAADRPYKRALPREKALDILTEESRAGNVDDALLTVFIEARVPERVSGATSS
jgi:HD-GYP domain-containing protein (c-di-GMP phosphodiesterase class II)